MAEWYERANQVLLPTYSRLPIHFERGEGPYLYDGEGERYLDALAGIAVNVLGYRHPRLVEVGQQAVNDVLHVSNLFHIEAQYELAEALNEAGFESSAFFCNSGAEAVEAAIKFARKYSKRSGGNGRTIVSFENSFHGRTLGALAATGQTKYQQGYEPLPGGFRHLPYNDAEALDEGVDEEVCAVLLEPIQGEGGVVEAEEEFLRAAREICDEREVLLLFDEVQTGMGRSGEFFCFQTTPVHPDVVSLAKGLAGGFPMGALLVDQRFHDQGFQPTNHASTFGGNPFVSRMALETVRIIQQEGLAENAYERGQQLRDGLRELAEEFDPVDPPCGRGLMLGQPLQDPWDAGEVMTCAREEGLIIGISGDNRLRFVPPLILTEQNVQELLEALRRSFVRYDPGS